MARNRSWRLAAAVAVIGSSVILFAAQFLWVVTATTTVAACQGNFEGCVAGSSYQTWWGLSTIQETWYSGAPNWWAALFVAAAFTGVTWGLLAIRRSFPRTTMAVTAGLTGGVAILALAINLLQLYRFETYWSPTGCPSGNFCLVTFSSALPWTIGATVALVVALIVATATLPARQTPSPVPSESESPVGVC